MRDPLSRDFSSLLPSQDSWLHRVRDNFHQMLAPAGIFPSCVSGAPLHLLNSGRTAAAGGARAVSLLTHAALLAGILLLNFASHGPGPTRTGTGLPPHGVLSYFPVPEDSRF